MKVRVLTDTIPAWLELALAWHAVDDVTVGQQARDELRDELWPTETEPRAPRGGTQVGHLAGGKTHGREATYCTGCRCAECIEARRTGNQRRRRAS